MENERSEKGEFSTESDCSTVGEQPTDSAQFSPQPESELRERERKHAESPEKHQQQPGITTEHAAAQQSVSTSQDFIGLRLGWIHFNLRKVVTEIFMSDLFWKDVETPNFDSYRVQMESEIQEILVQVSNLQQRRKWKFVMTDYKLDYIELLQQEVNKNPDRPLDVGKEEEQEEASSQCRTLQPPCSIPRRLVISPGLGGTPVNPQLTESLRRILFGGTFRVFNYEWRKSFFQFREPNSALSYALETDRGGARAIQMVIQARIIKYLLFNRQSASDRWSLHSLSEVGQRDQEKALAAALSDSLWLAGQEMSATVTLVTEDYCITPHLDYKLDNFTEKLRLFTFSEKEDVRKFVLDHIQCFKEEGSHGVILFLYSLICSRTVDRLKEDLDSTTSHLLYPSLGNFVCHQALLNLLLTGRATPHVFNGTLYFGEDGLPLEQPLQGILSRSDVGYLHWSREMMDKGRLPQVGSMLKTPRFPIWVCCINNSHSVLFSPNHSLLSDWRTEHLFQLYYYNGQSTQKETTTLTVDTHSHHWEASSRDLEEDLEKRFPSLEMIVRTKWEGAATDWNGTSPFY
ncbi:inactive ubiquitin carboxyl-terminal hydrolase MINDY-4B [Pholidichthys leucotaenia]